MAAVAIMALVITTSITVLQRGFLTLDTARNLAIAGQIMQSELEKMRLNDWATVSAYPAGPTTLTIDNVFTSNSAIGNRFTLQRTMSTPKTEFLQITLTITWNSVDGRTISRSYTTYYGHYGLYDYFYNTA